MQHRRIRAVDTFIYALFRSREKEIRVYITKYNFNLILNINITNIKQHNNASTCDIATYCICDQWQLRRVRSRDARKTIFGLFSCGEWHKILNIWLHEIRLVYCIWKRTCQAHVRTQRVDRGSGPPWKITLYGFVCWCLVVTSVCWCLVVPLGKDWLLGSRLRCLIVTLSLSTWYPWSGLVLDCIDFCSLPSFILLIEFGKWNPPEQSWTPHPPGKWWTPSGSLEKYSFLCNKSVGPPL